VTPCYTKCWDLTLAERLREVPDVVPRGDDSHRERAGDGRRGQAAIHVKFTLFRRDEETRRLGLPLPKGRTQHARERHAYLSNCTHAAPPAVCTRSGPTRHPTGGWPEAPGAITMAGQISGTNAGAEPARD